MRWAQCGSFQRGAILTGKESTEPGADPPIRFGSGEWTCVVGELEDGSRMVTMARWRDGAISEEYVWL
jgi:hypothetical protein